MAFAGDVAKDCQRFKQLNCILKIDTYRTEFINASILPAFRV